MLTSFNKVHRESFDIPQRRRKPTINPELAGGFHFKQMLPILLIDAAIPSLGFNQLGDLDWHRWLRVPFCENSRNNVPTNGNG